MDFGDKTLVCRDCAETFLFTAGEQEFFREKGLLQEPRRCPQCRSQRKEEAMATATPTPTPNSHVPQTEQMPTHQPLAEQNKAAEWKQRYKTIRRSRGDA